MCKISQLSDIKDLNISSNQNMVKYLDRLVKLEHQAAQKGVGMWTVAEMEKKSKVKTGFSVFKSVIMGPVNGIRWMYRKLRRN